MKFVGESPTHAAQLGILNAEPDMQYFLRKSPYGDFEVHYTRLIGKKRKKKYRRRSENLRSVGKMAKQKHTRLLSLATLVHNHYFGLSKELFAHEDNVLVIFHGGPIHFLKFLGLASRFLQRCSSKNICYTRCHGIKN